MAYTDGPTFTVRRGCGFAVTVNLPLVPTIRPDVKLDAIQSLPQAQIEDLIVNDPAVLLADGLELLAGLGDLLGCTIESAGIHLHGAAETRNVPRLYSVVTAEVLFPGHPHDAVRGGQDLRKLWHEATSAAADDFRAFTEALEDVKRSLRTRDLLARAAANRRRTIGTEHNGAPW